MSDIRSFDPRRSVADPPPFTGQSTIDETGAFHPAGTTGPYNPAPDADAPSIPGYEIVAEIARGGMGRVYAGRDLTLDREVAIKTLLSGADAERFVVEAKITARLPHPGIPPVHALGTLADGTPYLAMKRIGGRTLAELLKERSSPAHELPRFVQIFEQIAQAVGFAHTQGIIHRDLKPLNVMVGAFGEVQVMDWGLAKDVRVGARSVSEGAETTLADASGSVEATRAGTILGTPGYMAPEQARGEVVDAGVDVFSLGSILATILTGQPAFVGTSRMDTIHKAAKADLAEVLGRLDASGADAELIGLARHCLAARAGDRPADARAVAEKVAAYRAGVEARLHKAETERAAALVRAAEQTKRRRVMQWAGGAIAAVLLLGVVGTTIGLIRANQAAAAEKGANEQTQRRLAQIDKGVVLFAGMLTGINPRAEEQGGDPLYEQLRQRAAQAADELVGEAIGDPETVARLQTLLGNTLQELGDADKAVAVLEQARATRERALGADHPDTLTTLDKLGLAYRAAGKLPEAIALFEQVRGARVKKLGADHPDTLSTLYNLAGAYGAAGRLPEAIALFEQVRDAQAKTLGADHPDTLTTLNNLAGAYRAAGKLPEAIALFEQVRDARVRILGADHFYTLATLNNMALAYQAAGKLPEAIALFERVRDAFVKKLGADHPATLHTLNNLAGAWLAAGKLPEAIALYEQVRDVKVKKLGADHLDTLVTLKNLATAYWAADKLPEAVALFERVWDAFVKKLGADHPTTLITLGGLAGTYQAVGRLPEAISLFEQAAAGIEKRRFQHEFAGRIIADTVAAYEKAGQLDRAEGWQRKWLEHVRDKAGATSAVYAGELAGLGANLLQQQKWAEAEPVLRECLTIREKQVPDDWRTFNTQSMLGEAFLGQVKYADAEPLLLKGYEGMKERQAKMPPQAKNPRLREALDRLVQLAEVQKKPGEAAKWRKDREALQPK